MPSNFEGSRHAKSRRYTYYVPIKYGMLVVTLRPSLRFYFVVPSMLVQYFVHCIRLLCYYSMELWLDGHRSNIPSLYCRFTIYVGHVRSVNQLAARCWRLRNFLKYQFAANYL